MAQHATWPRSYSVATIADVNILHAWLFRGRHWLPDATWKVDAQVGRV
jgi:hypothetical protein